LGITEIEVFAKPLVSIISTGDELVAPEADIQPGKIRDINSYSIGALLEEMGAEVRRCGIVKDTFDELQRVVKKNMDSDLVLISGGSSVGVKDITIDILNSLGKPGVILHGVSIKPGKPTILASIDGKPVIGLPGHPSSSWTIFNVLIRPIIRSLRGEGLYSEGRIKNEISAFLSRNLVSDKGREEYIPVNIIRKEELVDGIEYIAEPIPGKSSLITTLVEADGFIRVDTFQEGLYEGDIVKVSLFSREGGNI